MLETLIGIIGAIIGSLITIAVNEQIRKKGRMEEYAKDVFSSRIQVYDDLLKKIYSIRKVEAEISKNEEISVEEKASIWSEITITMARYFDENDNKSIQVSEEINVHVLSMLFGYYSIFETDNKKEQEKIKNKFIADLLDSIDMIRSEGGFKQIENHFEEILKPKRRSDYIDLLKSLKKKYSTNTNSTSK